MKKLITILLLASCSAFGQSKTTDTRYELRQPADNFVYVSMPPQYYKCKKDTLKYQLSKHAQHTEKGTEYTSLFGLGDTVITRYGFDIAIKIIRWRNKKVRFEYFGGNGWFLESDLKLK